MHSTKQFESKLVCKILSLCGGWQDALESHFIVEGSVNNGEDEMSVADKV